MATCLEEKWPKGIKVSDTTVPRLFHAVDLRGLILCRSYHNMNYTLREHFAMILQNSKDTLFDPSFFEDRESKAIESIFRTVKPIIQFDDGEVLLKYNVGTRGNGKDAPRWPQDLMTEVVT